MQVLWTDLVATRLPALEAEQSEKTDRQAQLSSMAQTAESALRIAVLDAICSYGSVFFQALPV